MLVVHFEPFGVLEELKRLFEKHTIQARFIARDELKASDARGADLVLSVAVTARSSLLRAILKTG